MAVLNPPQRIILMCVGGILISSASGISLSIYLLVCVFLYAAAGKRLELLRSISAPCLFLILMYVTGGYLASGYEAYGLWQGLVKVAPILCAIFFVCVLARGIDPDQVESAVYFIVSFFSKRAAVYISFMAATSFRFLLEARAIWKQHQQIIAFRHNKRNILRYGSALVFSPFVLMLKKAEDLHEAVIFRTGNREPVSGYSLLGPPIFLAVLAFLIAIKVLSFYTG